MRKLVLFTMMAACAHVIPSTATALSVSAIVGDNDGFSTGVEDDDLILPWDIVTEFDDDPFTDTVIFGTQTFTFDYDLSGFSDISSVSLSLFTGGQGLGLFATTELYVDGAYIGLLTDGELGVASFARYDVFDISGIASIYDGSAEVEIRTKYNVDAWVLDYAEIVFDGSDTTLGPLASGNPIPEPSTIALMGLGFAGLILRRRSQLI